MVLGTSSDRLERPLKPLQPGDTTDVEFRIRTVHLGVGEYFINARVNDLGRSESDILWQGAMFHVEGSESTVGTVVAEVDFATSG
jgi:hypothetical protein